MPKYKDQSVAIVAAVPRYRTQHVLEVPMEQVRHIIRHLTCPCGYTALALMKAGRMDEVQVVLPHGAPEDGHRTGHLVQMHTVCEKLFCWDEYV